MVAQYEKVIADEPRGSSFLCKEFSFPIFTSPWHFHPEYELTLILESRGQRFVGDSVELFEAGDLVLLGPNLPHCWINSPPGPQTRPRRPRARSVVVQFPGNLVLRAGGDDCTELAAVRTLLVRRAPRGLHFVGQGARRVAERLRRLPEGRGLSRLLELYGILNGLACLPVRAIRPLTGVGYVPRLNIEQAGRLERVCRFVSTRFSEKITQRKAAELAHLSPAAFSRFFRGKMSKTFVEHLHNVRVSEACRLLIENDHLNVAEICYACGFGNLSNFNRHFRRRQGVSPRDYRQRHLAAGASGPFKSGTA